MKKAIYSKTVIQSLVFALAFGTTSLVFANPTNTANDDVDIQTATASSEAYDEGISANEYSTSTGTYDSNNADSSINTDTATDTDNSMEWTDSANTDTDNSVDTADSNNTDTDNSMEWTDSANTDTDNSVDTADSNNTDTDNSMEWTDSANTDTDNSVDTADSYNTDTDSSVNTDNSYNTDDNSNNLTIGNIGVAVALSSLSGTVTGAPTTVSEYATLYTGSNTVDNGAFNNAAGITQANMNTGFHALTQQSVNVQANMTLGQ